MSVIEGPTTIELILNWLDRIDGQLANLARHTRVRPIHQFEHVIQLGPQFDWLPLDDDGIRVQDAAHREYSEFVDFASVIMSRVVSERRETFCKLTARVQDLVHHHKDGASYEVPKLAERARAALRKQGEMLSAFAVPSERVIVVPDTSSLLAAPNLEAHDYGTARVEVVLVPVVLRQLDTKKQRGTPEARADARRLLADIRSHRKGGSLLSGVRIGENIVLRAIATEPRFQESLSWLDKDVEDDQLVASVFEITRENLGGRVVLVTEDINLENKATLARIPFCSTQGALANASRSMLGGRRV